MAVDKVDKYKMTKIIYAIIVSALFSSFAVTAVASEPAPKIFFSSAQGQYLANGKAIDTYFWSARYDFGDTFASNPMAQAEYNRYQHLMAWFPYLNWGALGLALTYGIVSTANNVYNDGVFWVSFLVPWISGIIVAGHANAHLQRAINLYNGVDPSLARNQMPESNLPIEEPRLSREMTAPKVAVNLLQFDF